MKSKNDEAKTGVLFNDIVKKTGLDGITAFIEIVFPVNIELALMNLSSLLVLPEEMIINFFPEFKVWVFGQMEKWVWKLFHTTSYF